MKTEEDLKAEAQSALTVIEKMAEDAREVRDRFGQMVELGAELPVEKCAASSTLPEVCLKMVEVLRGLDEICSSPETLWELAINPLGELYEMVNGFPAAELPSDESSVPYQPPAIPKGVALSWDRLMARQGHHEKLHYRELEENPSPENYRVLSEHIWRDWDAVNRWILSLPDKNVTPLHPMDDRELTYAAVRAAADVYNETMRQANKDESIYVTVKRMAW